MPYPRAYFYVLLVIAVTLAGFWNSYFSTFGKGPWQFHAHGVGASIWIMLVAAQSWTAHNKQFAWHAAAGKASLLLFPFLIGGLAAIIDLTASGYVAGEGATRALFGGAFLNGLLLAVAAYVLLFYRALKFRRKVWLHSGYMLGTPLILWESPFSRMLNDWVPGLGISGPQDFPRILQSILWAMASAVAFCLIVRWRVGERAQPFVVAAPIAKPVNTTVALGSSPSSAKADRTTGRSPRKPIATISAAIRIPATVNGCARSPTRHRAMMQNRSAVAIAHSIEGRMRSNCSGPRIVRPGMKPLRSRLNGDSHRISGVASM